MKLKRNLYILKCRAYVFLRQMTEKVLLRLSEWGWIYCHNVGYSNTTDDGAIHTAPDITSDRFIFSVSYLLRKFESKQEYWFETKSGKRIFTVYENHHVECRVSYRAELRAFFAHFSPRQRMWVDYTSPVVCFPKEVYTYPDSYNDPLEGVEVKTHRCDFSKCRFAFEFSYAPDLQANGMPSEVISQSYKVLENSLTSKVSEINKILTGADCDGEMLSPKKRPLSDNILCRHCGLPVFASAEHKYKFECLVHGELDYAWIKRVDPVEYTKVLGYTFNTLESLIQKSCPQDSNL